MMRSLLYIFVLLLLSACSAEKELTVTPKTYPSWYTNPPQSDQHFLYAVAQGHDKKEALANALEQMASTLSITVASDYSSETKTQSGTTNSYQENINSRVTTQVRPLRISDYKILEYKEQGFRKVLVLIRSDKQRLFNSLKQEMDARISQLHSQEKTIADKNVLEQLRFYKEADRYFTEASQTLNVMYVLNNTFDTAPYTRQASHYAAAYRDLRSKISFTLESDAAGDALLAPLRSGLSSEGLQIADRHDRYNLTVILKADMVPAQSMGFDLARTAITITVTDTQGRILGSNKLNITGQSTQGMALARENVAVKLDALIKKEGIAKVLGIRL